ncbi:alpha/beta hydrolase [Bacillus thermotolerans]|nr:alpha/beta fold hydrolase [Bacillus thermotolerans]
MAMIGCLCIHGFTGAPYEVQPLADYLSERTSWKIVVPTLPGHGEPPALKGVTYKQWLDCAEKEMQELATECDTVYVIGFSMGGLIAVYLAKKYSVEKLILLSAAAKYIYVGQLLRDLKDIAGDWKRGRLRENELFARYKRKLFSTPLSSVFQFRRVAASVKPLFATIQIPTLIVQGLADGIVPPKSAEYIYQHIASKEKELYYVPDAKHHVCLTGDTEGLFEKIFTFLTESSKVN